MTGTSSPPASSSSTLQSPTSARRVASALPAAPAPTTTKSNSLRWPLSTGSRTRRRCMWKTAGTKSVSALTMLRLVGMGTSSHHRPSANSNGSTPSTAHRISPGLGFGYTVIGFDWPDVSWMEVAFGDSRAPKNKLKMWSLKTEARSGPTVWCVWSLCAHRARRIRCGLPQLTPQHRSLATTLVPRLFHSQRRLVRSTVGRYGHPRSSTFVLSAGRSGPARCHRLPMWRLSCFCRLWEGVALMTSRSAEFGGDGGGGVDGGEGVDGGVGRNGGDRTRIAVKNERVGGAESLRTVCGKIGNQANRTLEELSDGSRAGSAWLGARRPQRVADGTDTG
ncbi:Protein of unknown function [Gryllus bimaculatus]|nr:Protein of unknown function [Gryllus bimaculatus]